MHMCSNMCCWQICEKLYEDNKIDSIDFLLIYSPFERIHLLLSSLKASTSLSIDIILQFTSTNSRVFHPGSD